MISLNTGGSTSPLITARMTKRRTGTAISRIVMNQWRRFNKRFFQRSTRNFENVLMFALTQNLTSTTRKGSRQKFADGRREGYLRKRRCLECACRQRLLYLSFSSIKAAALSALISNKSRHWESSHDHENGQ